MRTTYTLLALELSKTKAEAKITGEASYMNRPHTLLSMPFPSSPELTLFVDNNTGLISKMQRNKSVFEDLDYIHSEHKSSGGITYAGQSTFFINGNVNIVSVAHKLEFNVPVNDSNFVLPASAVDGGERVDNSEMIVNKLNNRVYRIGQNGGFGIFVDTPQGIISAGGYPAINRGLDSFREASGTQKLLTHQIVTHHHSDHVDGLAEAAAMGAKLVTVADNVESIKEFVTATDLEDRHFLTISRPTTFSEGKNRVEIYEVSTAHAASFLVTYVPAVKAIFIADHFGSQFVTGLPTANINTVTMLEALNELDLDIKTITTAHSGRVFTFKEMEQSVESYRTITCELDRPVCNI